TGSRRKPSVCHQWAGRKPNQLGASVSKPNPSVTVLWNWPSDLSSPVLIRPPARGFWQRYLELIAARITRRRQVADLFSPRPPKRAGSQVDARVAPNRQFRRSLKR